MKLLPSLLFYILICLVVPLSWKNNFQMHCAKSYHNRFSIEHNKPKAAVHSERMPTGP
jgi:hypothetical protein